MKFCSLTIFINKLLGKFYLTPVSTHIPQIKQCCTEFRKTNQFKITRRHPRSHRITIQHANERPPTLPRAPSTRRDTRCARRAASKFSEKPAYRSRAHDYSLAGTRKSRKRSKISPMCNTYLCLNNSRLVCLYNCMHGGARSCAHSAASVGFRRGNASEKISAYSHETRARK